MTVRKSVHSIIVIDAVVTVISLSELIASIISRIEASVLVPLVEMWTRLSNRICIKISMIRIEIRPIGRIGFAVVPGAPLRFAAIAVISVIAAIRLVGCRVLALHYIGTVVKRARLRIRWRRCRRRHLLPFDVLQNLLYLLGGLVRKTARVDC